MNSDEKFMINPLHDGVSEVLLDQKGSVSRDGKQNFVGYGNKNKIIEILVEKLKVDEGVANEIYNAVAGALASGALDKLKDMIKKG